MSGLKRIKRNGSNLAGKSRAECLFHWQQSEWAGTAFRRGLTRWQSHSTIEVSWSEKEGHCLKVWVTRQQMVSLSTAERELYVAVKTATEDLGIQSVTKDLDILCGMNLHVDVTATMCLDNCRGSECSSRRKCVRTWSSLTWWRNHYRVRKLSSWWKLWTINLWSTTSTRSEQGYFVQDQRVLSKMQNEVWQWDPCRWFRHRQ